MSWGNKSQVRITKYDSTWKQAKCGLPFITDNSSGDMNGSKWDHQHYFQRKKKDHSKVHKEIIKLYVTKNSQVQDSHKSCCCTDMYVEWDPVWLLIRWTLKRNSLPHLPTMVQLGIFFLLPLIQCVSFPSVMLHEHKRAFFSLHFLLMAQIFINDISVYLYNWIISQWHQQIKKTHFSLWGTLNLS